MLVVCITYQTRPRSANNEASNVTGAAVLCLIEAAGLFVAVECKLLLFYKGLDHLIDRTSLFSRVLNY